MKNFQISEKKELKDTVVLVKGAEKISKLNNGSM